ncbi:MAG: hypothetical protein FWD13_05580 [Treponema sp.]|nr:hypothetical protein [Treponema sp.]
MKDRLVSPIISNGMIIQRDSPFPVWSKKKLSITFLGKTYESINTEGKWLVTLDPAGAGGPYEMEITSDENSITIQDIYCGDVWLCSGQSNMEMQMDRLRDDFGEERGFLITNEELVITNDKREGKREEGKGNNEKGMGVIRHFKVGQEWDFTGERDELNEGGSWVSASVERLHEFTATGWFFAKEMYGKYGVPIGLINTAWGGTPVEAWMSEEALGSFPEKIAEGKQYADETRREEINKRVWDAINEWETNLIKEDAGNLHDWKNVDTDISLWNDINLPGYFADSSSQTKELNGFCGVIWLAKEFDISQDLSSGKTQVWLGTIVDADTVYINGTEIGNTGYRYPPRKYVPQGLLKQGKNRIVIRVTCNNGEGSVTCDKPFRIFTDNETVELSGTWKYKIGVCASVRPPEFFFQRQPMGNYNAMISPVLKFPLKGVIWYQGESNDSNPHDYSKLFPLMIQNWRKNNRNENLPFFFVQLPIWKIPTDNDENASWAIIREAQYSALSLPLTGIACALELGEWNDIHPINKKDVGYRLFLAAEKVLSGVNNSSPGPVIKEQRTGNNEQRVYLYFDNCGQGLISKDGLPHVSVIGNEGQVRLPAEIIEHNILCIDISSVCNPQKILYAWADNPRDRQLFNSDGLPALPFKININKG